MVQPWDDASGYRGFGFDRTWDVLGKLEYKLSNSIRFNLSYWTVAAHRKGFKIDLYRRTPFLYWDNGLNELFRDTERIALSYNHSLSPRTFFTIRYANFNQDAFLGVRIHDSDSDGYPDWFEWSHAAGERTNFEGNIPMSDPYNLDVVPYQSFGDSVFYTRRDGNGPKEWTSGWYYVDEDDNGKNDIVPGNYNWDIAEDFTDINRNGVFDKDIDFFDPSDDFDGNGVWYIRILSQHMTQIEMNTMFMNHIIGILYIFFLGVIDGLKKELLEVMIDYTKNQKLLPMKSVLILLLKLHISGEPD